MSIYNGVADDYFVLVIHPHRTKPDKWWASPQHGLVIKHRDFKQVVEAVDEWVKFHQSTFAYRDDNDLQGFVIQSIDELREKIQEISGSDHAFMASQLEDSEGRYVAFKNKEDNNEQ